MYMLPIDMTLQTFQPQKKEKYPHAVPFVKCPQCGSAVVEDTWTQTMPDQDGEPEERSGEAMYCSRSCCPYHLSPIDPADV